jgi:hypothetical protein
MFESGFLGSLKFLERNAVQATLFVVANSLNDPRKLELVQEAVRQGHEIASHSLTHPNLTLLDTEQKRREIAESREKIEKLLGVPVRGFRAPGYGIDRECFALLERYGYAYDSSVLPNRHFASQLEIPLSLLAAPQKDFLGTKLVELPVPRYRPLPFPFNPSYSLLLGMGYFRLGFRRFVKRNSPMVLLFHLTDMADPVPREWLNGLKASIFTLSIISRERKQAYCQAMLDMVRQHYQLLTTSALLTSPRLVGGQVAQAQ